jgi:mannose-6-phosphate isomerase-like protein (cupin superfamily)
MNSSHFKINLDQVPDSAPGFGMAEMGEARFLRDQAGAERIGMSLYRMNPGRRVGFGHRHGEAEEMYVVLSGSGRFRVQDEIVSVGPRDVVYCPPEAMREWEAGADGLELLAFGGHAPGDAEMEPGWWVD